MSIVKINAIHVDSGNADQFEKQFLGSLRMIEGYPGYESFQLLRPVRGDTRYFVMSTWATEADYANWIDANPGKSHDKSGRRLASKSELLEFETCPLGLASNYSAGPTKSSLRST